jgi:hypothetical protein
MTFLSSMMSSWHCTQEHATKVIVDVAKKGYTAAVKLLLEAGADVNAKDEVRLVRISFYRVPLCAL